MPRFAIVPLTLLALLLAAPSVQAAGRDVINDCTADEVMGKTYTQAEYRDALAKLPADADQYGNCRDIIARAQEAAARKGGSKQGDAANGSGGGGATTGGGASTGGDTPTSSKPAAEQLAAASQADRLAAEQAARDASTPALGAAAATPSAADVGRPPDTSGSADLPAPVIALLVLLIAGALALGAVRLRSLVHARSA
jgi:hypothetical protein